MEKSYFTGVLIKLEGENKMLPFHCLVVYHLPELHDADDKQTKVENSI